MSFVVGKTEIKVQTDGAQTKTIIADAVADLPDGTYAYELEAIASIRDDEDNLYHAFQTARALAVVQGGLLIRHTGPSGGPELFAPDGITVAPPHGNGTDGNFGHGIDVLNAGLNFPTTDPSDPLDFMKVTLTGAEGYLVDWSIEVTRRMIVSSGTPPTPVE